MITVLTLLILSFMQTVFLYMKICHQIAKQHDDFYELEATAHQLLIDKHTSSCTVKEKDPNQVIAMLWAHQGCAVAKGHHRFSYLISDLGVIPCLHIVSGNEHYSSHHWLLTVATEPPKHEILQLRMATPVKAMICEWVEARRINEGIISWRYLPIMYADHHSMSPSAL
jgi:hypothetical protein